MYFSSRFIRKRSKSLLAASDFEWHCTWYAKVQRKYEFVYLPIASPVDRLINRSKAHQSVVISVSHYIVRPHAQKQRDEESARRTSTAQKVSDRVRKNQAVAAVKKILAPDVYEDIIYQKTSGLRHAGAYVAKRTYRVAPATVSAKSHSSPQCKESAIKCKL